MKNIAKFNEHLEQATEIRTDIQDNLRVAYNSFKLMFEGLTGQKGKVLKHVVDMYHYRNGGYPSPNSAPKHQELIEKFALMVHWFNLIGFSKLYKDGLQAYGITDISIDPAYKIQDTPLNEEMLEIVDGADFGTHWPKNNDITFRQTIKAFVLACDEIQGAICSQSNVIKNDLAPLVEQACEIKKGDFTSSVMVNYQKTTDKITKRKVKNMQKTFKSKVEIGTFNIKSAEQVVED